MLRERRRQLAPAARGRRRSLTALAGAAGAALELWRFGPTDAAAARAGRARRPRAIRRDGRAAIARGLGAVATRSARGRRPRRRPRTPAARAVRSGGERAGPERAARRRSPSRSTTQATSPAPGRARRPTSPTTASPGPSTLFVTPSPLGLRLVHLQPIVGADGRAPRLGGGRARPLAGAGGDHARRRPTTRCRRRSRPASLRTRFEGAGDRRGRGAVLLRAPAGEPLAEASVAPATIDARAPRWRRAWSAAVMLALLAVDAAAADRPAARPRASAHASRARSCRATLAALGCCWSARRGALWAGAASSAAAAAVDAGDAARSAASPPPALVGAAGRAGRRGCGSRRAARGTSCRRRRLRFVAHAAARRHRRRRAARPVRAAARSRRSIRSSIDLRHFSLHPWSAPRIVLLAGDPGACSWRSLWGGTLLCGRAAARWRLPRRALARRAARAAGAVGCAPTAAGWRSSSPRAAGRCRRSGSCCLGGRLRAGRARRRRASSIWYRHATVAARILALFVAFLVPALLLYPSINFFAERATRELIATEYAVQAQNHVADAAAS